MSSQVLERDFTLGEVTGVLWSSGPDSAPTPALVLLGHGGGLHKKTPELVARAHHYVSVWGFTVVAVDAPGHGDRPRTARDSQARADLRDAMAAGDTARVAAVTVDYGRALARRAVPQWQTVIDALLHTPELPGLSQYGDDTPVGYGGGITLGTGIGVPLAAAEQRIKAAVFGGGFVVDDELLDAARRITVPVQFLLPWDDEHVDRQSALALFDAFASADKTLHANPGDHRTITWRGLDHGFLARHLLGDAEASS
ncbi:MAG: alpha/beta hydrolase [Nocardioides sp.]